MPSRARQHPGTGLAVYHATCWVLALIAVIEVVGIGAALALRLSHQPEPEIIERIVTVTAPAPSAVVPPPAPTPAIQTTSLKARTPDEILAALPEPKLEPLKLEPIAPKAPGSRPDFFEDGDRGLPPIENPAVEKLVRDGRDLLVAGDNIRAMLKLREALDIEPGNAQAEYFLGNVFEHLGQYDEAGDLYEKVYAQGTDAGVLYKRAAAKLARGFDESEAMVGKMSIGLIRKFQEKDDVVLTIPILSAASAEIDPQEVLVNARCFVKEPTGRIRLINEMDQAEVSYQFLSKNVNWAAGEETLRVDYERPDLEAEPEFYGYVVTLTYGNEVLDLKAWPRLLAQKIGQKEAAPPMEFPDFDDLPGFFEDLNPDNPLLPRKQ